MIKVIIADDEQKVCQLIYDLIHWDDFKMSVVGMAHNGIEALELIREQAPDLVITDIKMPGCDGLEIIQQAKIEKPDMDFIIISGYGFFEYAQNAIKYGVSDYLLKPIKKEEFSSTLKKMQEKFQSRQERFTKEEDLRRQMKASRGRVRENFLMEYLERKIISRLGNGLCDINEKYCMDFQEGGFFVFVVKIDYDYREPYEKGISLILTKAMEIIRQTVEESCYELECGVRGNGIWCVLNFLKEEEMLVRRKIKQAFDQIAVQKTVFPQFSFTCGIGKAVNDINGLDEALFEAEEAVNERLVKGSGKIFEYVNHQKIGGRNSQVLEQVLKNIKSYITSLDIKEMTRELEKLETQLSCNTSGSEVLKIISQISSTYVTCMKANSFCTIMLDEFEDNFHEKSGSCGSVKTLFACLLERMQTCTKQAAEEKKEDGIRPIRLAKNYILNNYRKTLTLEDMGNLTGFNASYFSLLFKKETGKNFMEYVMEVRMEKAKELLKETNESVAVICEKVGYSDIKHFTKNFKKETGLKPSEYRKLYS